MAAGYNYANTTATWTGTTTGRSSAAQPPTRQRELRVGDRIIFTRDHRSSYPECAAWINAEDIIKEIVEYNSAYIEFDDPGAQQTNVLMSARDKGFALSMSDMKLIE